MAASLKQTTIKNQMTWKVRDLKPAFVILGNK